MSIPSVRTERLLLRPFRPDDVEPWAAMVADPEVMEFFGGPYSRSGAWRALAVYIGHWTLRGYGLWAVEHEGRLVGRCGLWNPEGWPALECGWLLARDAWGRGFATEAARAALDWGFRELGAERISAFIAPGNVRSEAVAERLGMTVGGSLTLPVGDVPVRAWSCTRADLTS